MNKKWITTATIFPMLLALFLLTSSACGTTVTVDLDSTFQTIRGFGGNIAFVSTSFKTPAVVGPQLNYNLQNLRPTHLRFFFPLDAWEPTQGVRGETTDIHNLFVILQKQKQAGRILFLTANQIAPWMGTYVRTWNHSPTASFDLYAVNSAQIGNIAESWAQALVRLRDSYGVMVDYVSFNEGSNGTAMLTSSQYRDLVKAAGARFPQLGLMTKWVAGDDVMGSTINGYATPTLADPTALSYTGPIAYHGYNDQENFTDARLQQIATLGKTYGREIWMAESATTTSYVDRSTWANAYRLAINYQRSIKFAGSSTIFYWELAHQNRYNPIDYDTLNPYPTFWILKQYSDSFQPGSKIVTATDADAQVHSLAGKNVALNTYVVQLMVDSIGASKQVSIGGLPNGVVTLRQISSAQTSPVTVGSYTVVDNTLSLALPPWSVNTITGPMSGVTTNQAPAVSLRTNGTTFATPARVTFSAIAADSNGSMSRVEFFSGSAVLNANTTVHTGSRRPVSRQERIHSR